MKKATCPAFSARSNSKSRKESPSTEAGLAAIRLRCHTALPLDTAVPPDVRKGSAFPDAPTKTENSRGKAFFFRKSLLIAPEERNVYSHHRYSTIC